MGIGSVLVGIAMALIVGVYLARPFRAVRGGTDSDDAIEMWVAQARAEGAAPTLVEEDAEPVSFCPQCGRRVGPDDRFCAGCGTPLRGGAA